MLKSMQVECQGFSALGRMLFVCMVEDIDAKFWLALRSADGDRDIRPAAFLFEHQRGGLQ